MPRQDPTDFLPLSPATLAILLALAGGEQHGYGILKDVESQPDAPRIGTGTLYAALQRLTDDALIEETATPSAHGGDARRRYYRLTSLGRRVAKAETLRLSRVVALAYSKSLLPGWAWPPPLAGDEA